MRSPVQQAYLQAKARYESIQEQCLEAARPFEPRDIEGFARRLTAAERQLGYLQAYQDMKDAEQALIAWATSLSRLEQYREVANFLTYYRSDPDREAKVIELCLKIDVP